MSELGLILLRTVLIYFVVLLVMRFMGKREIGKLSIFDLVISVMVAEIAVIVIEDTKVPMLHGILPMVALMIIQVVLAYVTLKNRKLRLLFDGKPSVIIAKGKLNRKTMAKQRYNLDDMMLQLRENQISTLSDVEFAILETSGKLSIIKKDTNDTDDRSTKADAGKNDIFPPKFRYEILPIPLVMDGKVQEENLAKIEKNRFWLKNQLRQHGVTDMKEVFLCTIDHKGKLFVDKGKT
ncbi:YetF domain-containing protein [Paenibacillus sp. 1P07SE]|uniref:YetF domain-containing protein n=1 Tax=Paenibacillus sp. 1P07SE TaxID=3132209 RepID=UPI0039A43044